MALASPACLSPSEPLSQALKMIWQESFVNSLLPSEVLGWLVLPGIAKEHHRMIWVGKDLKTYLITDPLPWAETPPTRPGSSNLALSTS